MIAEKQSVYRKVVERIAVRGVMILCLECGHHRLDPQNYQESVPCVECEYGTLAQEAKNQKGALPWSFNEDGYILDTHENRILGWYVSDAAMKAISAVNTQPALERVLAALGAWIGMIRHSSGEYLPEVKELLNAYDEYKRAQNSSH